jgi:uncharacterized repeat protein (TIGR03803 family)
MPETFRCAVIVAALGGALTACGGGNSGYTAPTTTATASSSSSGAAPAVTVLYSFSISAQGGYYVGSRDAIGPLAQASDGSLYGSAQWGAPFFHITADGTENDINADINAVLAGEKINSPAVIGPDGRLYATLRCIDSGGFGTSGGVIASDLAGNLSLIVPPESAGEEGCDYPPPTDPVFSPNGTLYYIDGDIEGTTTTGVPVADFGATAADDFLVGIDGNLYGIFTGNGISGDKFGAGYFFVAVAPQKFEGVPTPVQVLYSFGASATDAANPSGTPVQGPDGNFYGASIQGGMTTTACPAGYGTIYRITPSGSESVLYEFGSNPNDQLAVRCPGTEARGLALLLTVGADGNLYGASNSTLYQITLSGQLTVLHTLTMAEGQAISGPLLQASDGNLYGVTQGGGANNAGTIFKLPVTSTH